VDRRILRALAAEGPLTAVERRVAPQLSPAQLLVLIATPFPRERERGRAAGRRKGFVMERSRRLFPLATVLFILGAASLSRFLPHVRAVDAVGLSGSGFALGVGFALLVFGLRGRVGP
jgi:hypothetical protein